MTYAKTLEFLFSCLPAYHRIGRAAYRNNLDNTIALDEYFGSPHRNYKTIHIAGTNGKGSVSHMLSSVLQEAGWKTGLYTSPHLKDFRERIRVNGRMIPKHEVTEFVRTHRKIIDQMKPSFFELTVAMAFDYFKKAGADVAVIETGLGGRLDSTNIISPVLSVITNIGHDHMDLLGDTIDKVAAEKAGIIKPGIPVVIGETQAETEKLFCEKAASAGSEVWFADRNFLCTLEAMKAETSMRKFTVNYLTEDRIFKGSTPLGGDYQKKNIQTLYQAATVLKDRFRVSEQNIGDGIRKVLRNTGLQGRWQIIGRNPLVICDTGHNKEGLEYVMNQLRGVPATDLHMVIGFVSDKDTASILPMFPREAKYYFTRASVLRAMDENVLRLKASESGLTGNSYHTVSEALNAARSNASATDVIFVGGSTFVVAEAI